MPGRGETTRHFVKEGQMLAPRRDYRLFDEEAQRLFLYFLAMSGNATVAAELVGTSRATAYRHRESNQEFGRLWDEARAEAVDRLEQEVWKRATEGVRKPVGFYMGKHGGTFVQEKSDNLLMFALKGERPEKYRDNVHHSGDATGGLAAQLQRALDRKRSRGSPLPVLENKAPDG